jgi:hypothetical protein
MECETGTLFPEATPTPVTLVTISGSTADFCVTEPDNQQITCFATQTEAVQSIGNRTLQAVFYSEPGYSGRALYVVTPTSECGGSNNLSPEWNDTISSVGISGQCVLRVYEHFDTQDTGSTLLDVRPPGADTDKLTVLVKQVSSWRLSP